MQEHNRPEDLAHSTVSVSVVCANYNHGIHLPDLLDSIRLSTVLPEEIILVDDGSTDDSLEKIRSYTDMDMLRVIAFPEHRGLAHALNEGVRQAKSKYIMRIDADDYIAHDRIEIQFNYLEEHPEIDILGSNATYFEHGTGRLINHSNFPMQYSQIRNRFERGEGGILHGTVMAKRELFSQFSYRQEYVPSEDYDIFARMVQDRYVMHNLEEPLTFVRVHKGNPRENISFKTIETNFQLRDQIFKTRTPKWQIWSYFPSLILLQEVYAGTQFSVPVSLYHSVWIIPTGQIVLEDFSIIFLSGGTAFPWVSAF